MKAAIRAILSCMFLAGCIDPVVYPYEGYQTIKGEGGFLDFREIIDKDIQMDKGYKYNRMDVYLSGLPIGKHCELIGMVASDEMQEVIDLAFELEGNTLTHSGVSFPIKFDNNTGILDNALTPITEARYVFTGNSLIPVFRYRYNAFECK